MDRLICNDDPKWMRLPREMTSVFKMEEIFPELSRETIRHIKDNYEFDMLSINNIDHIRDTLWTMRRILEHMLNPRIRKHRFYYPVLLVFHLNVRVETNNVTTYMIARVYNEAERSDIDISTHNLHEELELMEPTFSTFELLLQVVTHLVRNKYACGKLRYLPGFYKDLRIARDNITNEFIGVSLECLWGYLTTDKDLESDLPISEVLISLCELSSHIEFQEPRPKEERQRVSKFEVEFEKHKYESTVEEISGQFLIQRVLAFGSERPFFEYVLGRTDASHRIDVKTSELQTRYFSFLLETLVERRGAYKFLAAEGDNETKREWVIALQFISDVLLDTGVAFFSLLPELLHASRHPITKKKNHFLFKGFEPFPVIRFAISEMGFINPTEIPEDVYLVR